MVIFVSRMGLHRLWGKGVVVGRGYPPTGYPPPHRRGVWGEAVPLPRFGRAVLRKLWAENGLN